MSYLSTKLFFIIFVNKNIITMEVIDFLCSRRSIRKYTLEKVSEELVSEILKAGMYAPSANNQRPWHFIVIRDKETLEAITHIHPYSGMLHQASVAIVVCADLDLEKSEGYWVQDCQMLHRTCFLPRMALDWALYGLEFTHVKVAAKELKNYSN